MKIISKKFDACGAPTTIEIEAESTAEYAALAAARRSANAPPSPTALLLEQATREQVDLVRAYANATTVLRAASEAKDQADIARREARKACENGDHRIELLIMELAGVESGYGNV